MLCHRQEITVAPDGQIKYPSKTNYSDPKKRTINLICSRCIALLLLGRATGLPWDGKVTWQDDYKGMRRTSIKLQRREE